MGSEREISGLSQSQLWGRTRRAAFVRTLSRYDSFIEGLEFYQQTKLLDEICAAADAVSEPLTPPRKRTIQDEAQMLADEAHLFSVRELHALAPLYGIEVDRVKTVGDLRALVGWRRARDLRPQADAVAPCSVDEWLVRAASEPAPPTPGALSDDELWAEVERRDLATVIGYVNPDMVSEHEFTKGHVLWTRTWSHRWPVYGLRGGDSIRAATDAGSVPTPKED